jgi:putative nucleotidyltransferase with HDIG domain
LKSLARLIPSRIRWKIIAPYFVLTVVVAAAGTYFATRLVTGSLDDRFNNQLAEAARVTSDAVVRRERMHLETVRSITFTVGVTEAIAASDGRELRTLIEPILANDHREYVRVLDENGRQLIGLHLVDEAALSYETLSSDATIADAAIVRNVLAGGDEQGDKFAQVIQGDDGGVLYTGGPIWDGESIAGVVLVGSTLDAFLPAVKLEALADVTFYGLDGSVLSTTFSRGDGSAEELSRIAASDLGAVAGVRETKTLFGREFDMLYGELRVREQTVGLFSIALPSSFIQSAGAETRLVMMVIFGVATAFVLGIGVLIAHGVTSPLLSLVRTARAVTAGDLTVRAGLESRDEVGTLATSFNIMTDRLANQHLQTIRMLTSAIDARDPYTAGHSVRVGQLSVEIGRQLELPRRDLQFLEVGGYLHDVGKIGIRDNVLLKEGPLTDEERRMIEEHPRIGINIVKHVDLPSEVFDIVSGHHEKLDGTGYPYGLNGEGITLFARIAAVADVYDALTTERPYKPALAIERAVEILRAEVTANHLDVRAVEGLVTALPVWSRRLSLERGLQGLSLGDLEDLRTGESVA